MTKDLIRVFIAVEIPDKLKNKIHIFGKKQFEKIKGVRLVAKENLHLTIRFLGNQNIEIIEKINSILKEKFSNFSIEFEASDWGCFPNNRNPRVIWIGLKGDIEKLKGLKKDLDNELQNFGIESDNKFKAHITIGRVKKPGINIKTVDEKFGKFIAKKFVLFKSTLTPRGSIYEKL